MSSSECKLKHINEQEFSNRYDQFSVKEGKINSVLEELYSRVNGKCEGHSARDAVLQGRSNGLLWHEVL